MELIIGGRAQGKLEYAIDAYGLDDADISRGVLDGSRAVYRLQDAVRDIMKSGGDADKAVSDYMTKYPDTVFICDEIGSGLVPVDAFEREYRETVGRICRILAKNAHKVVRIYCGLPTVLKDE